MFDVEIEPNTFWQDFAIAERFGMNAIKDTYKMCKSWQDNVKMWTALVLVLNHKIWHFYKKFGDCAITRLYDKLWREADDFARENFKGKDAVYYYQATD